MYFLKQSLHDGNNYLYFYLLVSNIFRPRVEDYLYYMSVYSICCTCQKYIQLMLMWVAPWWSVNCNITSINLTSMFTQLTGSRGVEGKLLISRSQINLVVCNVLVLLRVSLLFFGTFSYDTCVCWWDFICIASIALWFFNCLFLWLNHDLM